MKRRTFLQSLAAICAAPLILTGIKKRGGPKLINGGLMTIDPGGKTFSIAAGSGVVIDASDPNNPIQRHVEWNNINSIYPHVGIDISGYIVESHVKLDHRKHMILKN